MRIPSGRAVDSTWTTSAPSAARAPVDDGPAHHAVRSSTLTPANGRRGGGVEDATAPFPAGVGRLGARHRLGPGRDARPDGTRRRAGAGGASPSMIQDPARHAERPGRIVDEHPAGHRVVDPEHPSTVHHRRDRDPEQRGPLDDLGRRVLRRPVVDDAIPLVPAGGPGGVHGPARVVLEQVGALDEQAEALELLAGVGVEADVAVQRRLDRRRLRGTGRGRVGQVGPTPHRVGQVGEVRAGEVGDLGPRHVDQLARPGGGPPPQHGQGGDGGVHAGDPLGDLSSGLDGRATGATADGQATAVGLDGQLGGRAAGVGPVQPVRRDGHDDEPGMTVGHLGGRADRADPVRDEHVRPGDQRRRRRPVHDRTVAVAQIAEQGAVLARPDGRPAGPPPQCLPTGRFDQDDLGPGVAEQLGAVAPGDARRRVDHPGGRPAHPRHDRRL